MEHNEFEISYGTIWTEVAIPLNAITMVLKFNKTFSGGPYDGTLGGSVIMYGKVQLAYKKTKLATGEVQFTPLPNMPHNMRHFMDGDVGHRSNSTTWTKREGPDSLEYSNMLAHRAGDPHPPNHDAAGIGYVITPGEEPTEHPSVFSTE